MTSPTPDYEAEIDKLLDEVAFQAHQDDRLDCEDMQAHQKAYKSEAKQALLALLDRARAEELQTIQLHMVIHEYDIPMDKRLDEYLGKRIAVLTDRLPEKEKR